MLYMVTFTIHIPQMLAYIYTPYMDPMGNGRCQWIHYIYIYNGFTIYNQWEISRIQLMEVR